ELLTVEPLRVIGQGAGVGLGDDRFVIKIKIVKVVAEAIVVVNIPANPAHLVRGRTIILRLSIRQPRQCLGRGAPLKLSGRRCFLGGLSQSGLIGEILTGNSWCELRGSL